MPRARYDLVIVGMGSAGMTAAEFAATLPIKVCAIERDRVGGDCLWTGCVPSKALLASAKAAHTMRHADRYGLAAVEPAVDRSQVWERVRAVQAQLAATTDAPEHFTAKGIELRFGEATLTSPTTLTVNGEELEAKHVLLCTGGRPAAPPIPGLEKAGYLTSENLFELTDPPASVVIIGGGPIAVELAQAFARLDMTVTVLQGPPRILPREDPELVALLTARLREEGVNLQLGVRAERVEVAPDGTRIVHAGNRAFRAEAILVATGRAPNVEGLGLDRLGVDVAGEGGGAIAVDDGQRTSVKSVWAAGDVAGGHLFTHAAGFEAARAVRNMLFPGTAHDEVLVPWATFTDPELAHAGFTEAEAVERFGDEDVEVHRHDLRNSDRARAEGAGDGQIVVVTHKGRVVGGHALAPAAGELIHELALAIREKQKLSDLAGLVHVYPTIALGIQQLAAQASYAAAQRFRFLVRSSA
ncbi:MAG: FAD-dependent oxidoreductase [Actinomycetota bacterium]|nr:FAD-dependent oxidoreductase [Actinomycetota bacterium]